MKQKKFSISKRLKSFVHAFSGLRYLLRDEHNSRIHLIAAVLVVILAIIFRLDAYEWIAIIFSIGLVVTVEIINTVIENISDFISPGKDEKIKKIKDLSAAAVLISAVTALSIALVVLLPKMKI